MRTGELAGEVKLPPLGEGCLALALALAAAPLLLLVLLLPLLNTRTLFS